MLVDLLCFVAAKMDRPTSGIQTLVNTKETLLYSHVSDYKLQFLTVTEKTVCYVNYTATFNPLTTKHFSMHTLPHVGLISTHNLPHVELLSTHNLTCVRAVMYTQSTIYRAVLCPQSTMYRVLIYCV